MDEVSRLQRDPPAEGEPQPNQEERNAQAQHHGPRVEVGGGLQHARPAEANKSVGACGSAAGEHVWHLRVSCWARDQVCRAGELPEAVCSGFSRREHAGLSCEYSGIIVRAGDGELGKARGIHGRDGGWVESEESLEDLLAHGGLDGGVGRQAVERNEVRAGNERD